MCDCIDCRGAVDPGYYESDHHEEDYEDVLYYEIFEDEDVD